MKLHYSWIPYFILISGAVIIACTSDVRKTLRAEQPALLKSVSLEITPAGYFQAVDAYRLEVEEVLLENELLMIIFKSDLERESKSANSYYINQINDLEQKTRDLQDRLEAYPRNDAAGWIEFKDEFDTELEELTNAHKLLSVKKSN
jgi:hypothetical protein